MGITFEDIQKANATIKTTPIKNKDYAEVPQRIKAFRMLYPTGSIVTDLVSDDGERCVFKATVYDDQAGILGTGTAFELKSSTFINKTSYIENCETSAVGRALAMCGIGIDVSIASAEEVTNAINNQGDNMQPLPILEEPKEKKTKKAEQPKEQVTPEAVMQKTGVTREQMIECAKAHYPGDKMDSLLKCFNVDSIEKASATQLMVVWNKYGAKA